MGTLNVRTFTFHPKQIFETEDFASDLQALLRTETGGGNGDTTKVTHFDVEVIMGTVVVTVVIKS
jgi:hypothetical protein